MNSLLNICMHPQQKPNIITHTFPENDKAWLIKALRIFNIMVPEPPPASKHTHHSIKHIAGQ